MIIIGISGTNGSGKDTIAKLLADKHGFYSASATDMFEQELKRRGLPFERQNKRALSAEWRRKYGLGVVVDKGVEEAKAAGFDKLVVGSLRNSGEVDRVHELGGTMVWVDADPKVRYERITKNNRGRVEDQKSFEQFLAEEQAEMEYSGDKATLNMSEVKTQSDKFLENNSSDLQVFVQKAETLLQDLL